jgi:TMEM175 potassium channel family protein
VYPKARLDALTDGVFAVAMTLLVLDIRLPEDFHPADQSALVHAVIGLWPKFLPYVISFFVLGLRWLSSIQVTTKTETVGGECARWWLLYLLLITCVPFTAIVVGRFPYQAPAIWLYAGNTALVAAVAARMMALLPDIELGDHVQARRLALGVLFASSLIAIMVSVVAPRLAIWAMALNVLTPLHVHWMRRKAG